MKLSKSISNIMGVGFVLLGLSGAFLISRTNEKPTLFITKQQSGFNIDNNFFSLFNMGQKRLYSSLLWVATILESDQEHYKGKDLNSWMYLRFLSISNLEPKFLMTYTFGGPYLSIIKDDLEGASVIYDKGLTLFPDNGKLINNAAFHYQFEKIDHNKSYKLYQKLNQLSPTNLTVISQFARLESERGNLENAFVLLSNLYKEQTDKNSALAKKIHSFLYSIKSEIDLTCLNGNKANCATVDLDNEEYVKVGQKFKAKKTWIPFRTKAPLKK